MKLTSLSCLLPALGIAAVMAGAPTLHAQYIWNRNSTSSYSWGTDTNWTGNRLPPDIADEQVRFDNYSGASPVVNLDKGRQLDAGLYIRANTSNSGTLTLNLSGHRLTLNGSDALFDPNSSATSSRTTVLFTGGTVQFGSVAATNLVLGATSGDGYAGSSSAVLGVVFDAGTTFDSANLNSIQIVSGSATRLQNMELDLSAATLVSGANAGVLKVNQSVAIGQSLTTSPSVSRHKYGSLKLGVVSEVEIGGDLVIGANSRTNANDTNARGSLIFSYADGQGEATLRIGGAFRLGVGAGAEGTLEQAPETLHTVIGSSDQRGGSFQVGYKQTTAAASGDASGSFVAQSGSFNANVTELRIGQNASSGGKASGVVDLRDADLGILDISGAAVIGSGNDATGELRLRAGEANSASLTVGAASGSPTGRSLLSLNGTEWSVSDTLTIGASGDIEVTVDARALGGITLLSDAPGGFVIEEDGRLSLLFESSGSAWGLRLSGDYADLLEEYLGDQRIVIGGAYGSYADIYSEGGYTYLGYHAIPEPSTSALLGILTVGWTLHRSRRTRCIMKTPFSFLKHALAVALAALTVAPASADTGQAVLLSGPDFAIKTFARHVITPLGWEAVKEEAPPSVQEYAKYRAVVLVEQFPWNSARDESFWNVGDNEATVREYVSRGGKIVLIGAAWPRKPPRKLKSEGAAVRDLSMLNALIGFGHYPNKNLLNPVIGQPAGKALFEGREYDFVAPYSVTIGKISTAQVLATVRDKDGRDHVFATVNHVGEGKVYWFSTSPFRLAREVGADSGAALDYFRILQKILQE